MSQAVIFGSIGAIGFLFLIISFLIGDLFDLGESLFDGDGIDGDVDGPTWLSSRVLSAAVVGFGAFGYLAVVAGLPAVLTWLIASVGFVFMGAGVFFGVVRPLARQQGNSMLGRQTYVGKTATVSLPIRKGGVGRVEFRDDNGARVTQSALTESNQAFPANSRVRIVDVTANEVVVDRIE